MKLLIIIAIWAFLILTSVISQGPNLSILSQSTGGPVFLYDVSGDNIMIYFTQINKINKDSSSNSPLTYSSGSDLRAVTQIGNTLYFCKYNAVPSLNQMNYMNISPVGSIYTFETASTNCIDLTVNGSDDIFFIDSNYIVKKRTNASGIYTSYNIGALQPFRISASYEGFVGIVLTNNRVYWFDSSSLTPTLNIITVAPLSSSYTTEGLGNPPPQHNPDIAFSHMDNGSPVLWLIDGGQRMHYINSNVGCGYGQCMYDLNAVGGTTCRLRISLIFYDLPMVGYDLKALFFKCSDPTYYWDQKTATCVSTCPSGTYSVPLQANVSNKNYCKYCKANNQYLILLAGVYSCVSNCAASGYFTNSVTFECYLCSATEYYMPETKVCVSSCLPYNRYYINIGGMNQCTKCKGWKVPSADGSTCVECAASNTYFDPKSRTCVSDCKEINLLNFQDDLGGNKSCFDCPPYFMCSKNVCMEDCYRLALYSHMKKPSENRFALNMCDTYCCPC